jgi:hypothetical protein
MARYGTWRPLDPDTFDEQPLLTTPDIIGLHTMVGTLPGTDALFRRGGYAGTFSHFGMDAAGAVWQWQDTRYRAAANYAGNHRIISVETADHGPPFAPWTGEDVPAWTAEQVEALARLVAFLCTAHDIPCELIPDSRAGRRGVGYHRQGIDGAYPDHRVPDGEVWSTLRGKVCPGARRIAQIPRVIARARELLQQEGDAMPLPTDRTLTDRDLQTVRDATWQAPIDDVTAPGARPQAWEHLQWANGHAAYARAAAERAEAKVDAVLASLGNTPPAVLAELGEIKAAVVKVATGGVDYQVLASALADELLGRLAAAGDVQ